MKRLEILDAIEQRLTSIVTTNGFLTDIGSSVDYFSELPWEYGELGAVAYSDPEEHSFEIGMVEEHHLFVEIEAIAFSDNPKLMGIQILSDLKTAIGLDVTWSGLALRTQIVNNDKNVQTLGSTAVRVALQLEIVYRTEKFEV